MEREQEERGRLARPRLITGAAAGLLLLPGACGRGDPARGVEPEIQVRLAWVGEAPDGMRIVAEPFPDHRDYLPGATPEESMLRERLRLGRDLALLRVHLIGPASDLQASGRIRSAGEDFTVLPPSPEPESARNLLLRATVVEGGPAPDPAAPGTRRRSFVMGARGRRPGPGAPVRWVRGSLAVPLEVRRWTEVERRRYMEAPEETAQAGHSALPRDHE